MADQVDFEVNGLDLLADTAGALATGVHCGDDDEE